MWKSTSLFLKLAGYRVEKGTAVFINNHIMNMSPELWDRPEQYDPFRFLSGGLDQVLNHFWSLIQSCRMFCKKRIATRFFPIAKWVSIKCRLAENVTCSHSSGVFFSCINEWTNFHPIFLFSSRSRSTSNRSALAGVLAWATRSSRLFPSLSSPTSSSNSPSTHPHRTSSPHQVLEPTQK